MRLPKDICSTRAVCACVVVVSVGVLVPAKAQAPAPAGAQIKIVSPGDQSFVSGPTLLRALIDPPDAVVAVTFFADGRQVCSVTHPPFECDWDAGAAIGEHQIRAVGTLAVGGRLVHTVRTKGVGYSERVD